MHSSILHQELEKLIEIAQQDWSGEDMERTLLQCLLEPF